MGKVKHTKVKHPPALMLLTPRGGSHNHCYVLSQRSLELSVLSSVFSQLKSEIEGRHPTLEGRQIATGHCGHFYYAARRAQQRGGRYSYEIAAWLSHHTNSEAEVLRLLTEALERFDERHSSLDWEYGVEGGILVDSVLSQVESELLGQEQRPDAKVTFEVDALAASGGVSLAARVVSVVMILGILSAVVWQWTGGVTELMGDVPSGVARVDDRVETEGVSWDEDKDQKRIAEQRPLDNLKDQAQQPATEEIPRIKEEKRCDQAAFKKKRGDPLKLDDFMKKIKIVREIEKDQLLLSFSEKKTDKLLEHYRSETNSPNDMRMKYFVLNLIKIYELTQSNNPDELRVKYIDRFKNLSGCFDEVSERVETLEKGLVDWIKEAFINNKGKYSLQYIDQHLYDPIKECRSKPNLSLCAKINEVAKTLCERPEMEKTLKNKDVDHPNACKLTKGVTQ